MLAIRHSPLVWAALMTFAVVAADYITGPFVQVSIFYIAPVAVAAINRAWCGCLLAFLLPLSRISLYMYWDVDWSLPDTASYAVIRISALLAAVLMIRFIVTEPQAVGPSSVAAGRLPWQKVAAQGATLRR
jgi:hypothetical protein